MWGQRGAGVGSVAQVLREWRYISKLRLYYKRGQNLSCFVKCVQTFQKIKKCKEKKRKKHSKVFIKIQFTCLCVFVCCVLR